MFIKNCLVNQGLPEERKTPSKKVLFITYLPRKTLAMYSISCSVYFSLLSLQPDHISKVEKPRLSFVKLKTLVIYFLSLWLRLLAELHD